MRAESHRYLWRHTRNVSQLRNLHAFRKHTLTVCISDSSLSLAEQSIYQMAGKMDLITFPGDGAMCRTHQTHCFLREVVVNSASRKQHSPCFILIPTCKYKPTCLLPPLLFAISPAPGKLFASHAAALTACDSHTALPVHESHTRATAVHVNLKERLRPHRHRVTYPVPTATSLAHQITVIGCITSTQTCKTSPSCDRKV